MAKSLNFTLNRSDGKEMTAKEQQDYTNYLLKEVAEAFLVVSAQYGITEQVEGSGEYFLTEMGRRVLLHLLDAEKFVALLTEAHAKFRRPLAFRFASPEFWLFSYPFR